MKYPRERERLGGRSFPQKIGCWPCAPTCLQIAPFPSLPATSGGWGFYSLFTGVDYGLRGGLKEPSHTVRMQVVCDFYSFLLGDVSVKSQRYPGRQASCWALTLVSPSPAGPGHHLVCAHTPLWTLVQVQNPGSLQVCSGAQIFTNSLRATTAGGHCEQ